MTAKIPNFRGMKALILHRPDGNCVALADQLRRLAIEVQTHWPPNGRADVEVDVLFFDVDQGFDGMFPWRRGEPPMPLVAIVGSETPGRLEWAIEQAPAASILKPIGSNGAFHALVTAFNTFAANRLVAATLRDLESRLLCRQMIVRTILSMMDKYRMDDNEAFRLLRSASMRRRISVEEMSQQLLNGTQFDHEDFAALSTNLTTPAKSRSGRSA
jgi:AmiR/NasT family two-component response regulator